MWEINIKQPSCDNVALFFFCQKVSLVFWGECNPHFVTWNIQVCPGSNRWTCKTLLLMMSLGDMLYIVYWWFPTVSVIAGDVFRWYALHSVLMVFHNVSCCWGCLLEIHFTIVYWWFFTVSVIAEDVFRGQWLRGWWTGSALCSRMWATMSEICRSNGYRHCPGHVLPAGPPVECGGEYGCCLNKDQRVRSRTTQALPLPDLYNVWC